MIIRKYKNLNIPFFYKLYIIIFGSILALILLALAVLWFAMNDYEKSIPENLVKPYVHQINERNFDKLVNISNLSEYETKESCAEYLKTIIGGEKVSYSRLAVSDKNKLVYKIKTDKTDIATVELKKDSNKSGFGNEKYVVSSVTSCISTDNKMIINAPDFAKFSINGKAIKDSYIKEKNIPVKELELVPDSVKKPRIVKYEIRGVLPGGKIKATDAEGNELFVTKNEKNGEYSVSFGGKAEEGKQYDKLITDVSQAFGKFVTNDVRFNEVGQYLAPESSVYEMISRMESMWYTPHDKYEFKNIQTSEYQKYSDDCFSYRIKFDHFVYRYKENQTTQRSCDYTYIFAKKNGKWLVYDLIMHN